MKKHIAELLMEYAGSKGAKGISDLPGLWTSQLDEQWLIKCNGHIIEVEGAVNGRGWNYTPYTKTHQII